MEKLLTRIAWFVGLVLVQVLFLNHICWFGVATPFLYIYLLLIIDRDIDRNVLMLLAFAMGLSVDVFCNTFGVNAAACVLLAFLRPWLIRICAPRDEFENFEPGIQTLGIWSFFRYALLATLIHHTALFFLESFSVRHIGFVFLRIVFSALLALMMVMAVDFVRNRR